MVSSAVSESAAARSVELAANAQSRLLRVSLLAVGCMWVLPFLVPTKTPPIPSFHAEMVAAMLGLVAMTALAFYAAKFELPRVALLPLALGLLILVHIILGRVPYRQFGLLGIMYLLWASGLILLGGLLRRELGLERITTILSWFLIAGAMGSALVGWAQYIDSGALSRLAMPRSPDRVWGNLGQPNQLADYLALGLIGACYLYANDRLRLGWAVAFALAGVYIINLTGSRASWAYLAAMVAVSGVYFGLDRSQVNRRLLGYAILCLVLLVVLPWAISLVASQDAGGSTVSARTAPAAFADEQRLRIWKSALLMFLDSPLFGVGFKAYGWRQFQLNFEVPEVALTGLTNHAHNVLLQVLAEFGLSGLLLLAAFAVLWATRLLRQPRTAATWWLWSIVTVLAIHSMVEYPLWYTFFLGIAAIVLGLGEMRTIELRLRQRERLGKIFLLGLLGLGWIVCIGLYRDYLALENLLTFRYRFFDASPEVGAQVKMPLLTISRGSLLVPYVDLGLMRTIQVDREQLPDKLLVNAAVMRLFPIEDIVYRQAMLLALNGDEAAAERQWDYADASFWEQRDVALSVLGNRVNEGFTELAPLLTYARKRTQ
jgi:O-antigen ligase